MSRIEQTLARLTRRLIAHEVPVQRLCWNPGLSPPVEMFLDGDLTPMEHHRAVEMLLSFWLEEMSCPGGRTFLSVPTAPGAKDGHECPSYVNP